MQNYARIGIFGILALVALRVGCGWHFYMEGASKVKSHTFSSEGFLNGAKGPLAGKFQELIWDKDGSFRLNQETVNAYFIDAAEKSAVHFGLTDEQKKQLDRVRRRYANVDKNKRFSGKLNDVYDEASEDVFKYWESVGRLENMEDAALWTQVSSLRGQKEKIEADRMASVKPTMAAVDAIWNQYEGQLNAVATPEQLQQAGYFRFNRPGEGVLTTRTVDKIIPIFDMVVGILLMLGLLTPLAAWAGALFLISVVLSQMPGFPGTDPTYFQAVEALAMIVLATTDAGRYAGLDFIPWAWWQSKKKKSPETTTAPAAT
tara:strand:+ start:421 stop:1371 length:951 start_codon:yes stop_codon:yes gene_type:complete